jgi:hypothetical protein
MAKKPARSRAQPRPTTTVAVQHVEAKEAASASWMSEITDTRIAVLEAVGRVARRVVESNLNDANFHKAVQFAYDARVMTAERLAVISKADRSTVGRWLKEQSAPVATAQEAILLKIAAEADAQVDELRPIPTGVGSGVGPKGQKLRHQTK